MTPEQLVDFYGSQVLAAKALGTRQSMITRWVRVYGRIPLAEQFLIQEITNGRLKADRDDWQADIMRMLPGGGGKRRNRNAGRR